MNIIENESDDAMIPCELCNEMIRFSSYDVHARTCAATNSSSPAILFYRDDDDNRVYSINIAPAIATFQRLQLQQDPRSTGDANINDSQDMPMTMLLLPTLIPVAQTIIDIGTEDLNALVSDIVGPVHVGLSNLDMVLSQRDCKADDVCPICQDIIHCELHVKTLCNHSYCRPCITSWFAQHTRCPMCNADQRDIIN